MVGLKSLLSLCALPLALGKVYNMTAPETASPGQNITAVLYTHGYIQNLDSFGVIWGLKTANINCPQCVGKRISYDDLFFDKDFPQGRGNATFQVPIPENTQPGVYTFVASVPYLVGASGGTGFSVFNQSITIEE